MVIIGSYTGLWYQYWKVISGCLFYISGYDPVAVLRWAILRAFFRAFFAFLDAGKRHRQNSGNLARLYDFNSARGLTLGRILICGLLFM